MTKLLSLRVVLALPFVVVIFVVSGLIGLLAYRNGQVAVTTLAGQLHQAATARVHEHMDAYLAAPLLATQLNLDSISLGEVSPQDLDALEQHFLAQMPRFPMVISLAYADQQRQYVGASRKLLGVELSVARASLATNNQLVVDAVTQSSRERIGAMANYDPRIRPWYQAAVQAGKLVWTPIYVWSSGDVGVDAVAPVYTNNQLIGVLDTSLTLRGISDFLRDLQISPHGEAFIVDADGLLVAASSGAYVSTGVDTSIRRIVAAESEDHVVRTAMSALLSETQSLPQIEASRQFSFTLDGQRQYAQVTPYRTTNGLNWLIVTVIPETDFMAQITEGNRTTALMIAAAIAAALLVAFLAANWVTRPIIRLHVAADALAGGAWPNIPALRRADEIGDLARTFGVMATRLQASFASLSESEARYRGLFEAVPIGLYRATSTGARLAVNPAGLRILGYADGEQPQMTDQLFTRPEDYVLWQAQVAQAGVVSPFEAQLRRCDGSLVWVRIDGQVTRDAEGKIQYVEGSIVDITDQRQAEDALRASEARYRIISELASDYALAYIIAADGTAQLEWITDAFTRITGYPVDEMRDSQAWPKLIYPEDVGVAEQHTHRLLGGSADVCEYRVLTKDGRIRWLRFYDRPTWDSAEGRVTRVCGAVQDITDIRRLEVQLAQASKLEALGRMASGIAHDFNNLLTVILGTTAILDLADDSATRQDAAQIRQAAERAVRLIRQLLAFSRQQTLEPRILDLGELVVALEPLLRRLIGENITLIVELASSRSNIKADPGQIEQVIMNLAANARDAMPTGGTLRITVADGPALDNQALVQLIVSDTGTGMNALTSARMFEPFFTTKPVGQGTGLGLAMAHGIISQSGGTIDVESALGQGTTFTIGLPRVESGGTPMLSDSSILPGGKGALLLAEDEPQLRMHSSDADT